METNSILKRFQIVIKFIILYLGLSFFIRFILYVLSFKSITFSLINLCKIIGLGIFFDFGIALFFIFFYLIYLLIIPKKWIGSIFDKILTYFILFITLIIVIFSLMAEFPFWDEFNTRFNFIAVDYLIYTYEVVENINQSYPLPLLIGGLLLIVSIIIYVFNKLNYFKNTFSSKPNFLKRLAFFCPILIILLTYNFIAKNSMAEWSENLYENELSKNGTFSFFSAFRSNELDFKTFYKNLPENKAFYIIRNELKQENETFNIKENSDINRKIINDSIEKTPNIVIICIESLSADFMNTFGNNQNLTPYMDSIAKKSILFTNVYATGTRTVRGMEALTLSVPPTPGNSIVRRPNNDHIFSIGNVAISKNYQPYFIYGGDGYFDNMNTFFGGQGFNIIDRNRGNPLSDQIKTERFNIENDEVKFENAWGISDEDIYTRLLKEQNQNHIKNKKSMYFVMTTSNHKPYTFPDGKIDIKQGSREGAVKYTDFALGKMLENAKKQPWFKNTIYLIVADHCASSAGKWEINIEKHHIPAMIYNSGFKPEKIEKLVSQIDLMPTLFSLLNWSYNSEFYGKDIFKMKPNEQRALIGNYRTLGLLTNNSFVQINDRKKVESFYWNQEKAQLIPLKNTNKKLENKTISYYQTASYRFKNGKMKINN